MNAEFCICPDAAEDDTLPYCMIHGDCEGCRRAVRNVSYEMVFDRMCPMHGVVAEDQRALRLQKLEDELGPAAPT